MPRYAFLCVNCTHELELNRPVAERDAPVREGCPQCGHSLRRVFAPTTNFLIPAHFGLERGWHLPDDPQAPRGERNAPVKPIARTSLKEKLIAAGALNT
jgi:putative FmdB family regulatory protein